MRSLPRLMAVIGRVGEDVGGLRSRVAEGKSSRRMIVIPEDPNLWAGEPGRRQERGELVVGLVEDEPLCRERALGDSGHVLAELVAEGEHARGCQGFANLSEFAHRVSPEVQDMAGDNQVGWREGPSRSEVTRDQLQPSRCDGPNVARRFSTQRGGVDSNDAGLRIGDQQLLESETGTAAELYDRLWGADHAVVRRPASG